MKIGSPRAKLVERVFYILCIGLVAFAAWSGLRRWWNGPADRSARITVTVSGNVRHPGPHRIPLGSSLFDVLMAAGVVLTSDVGRDSLSRPVRNGEKIQVGKLDARVDMAKGEKGGACAVDFLRGTVDVFDRDNSAKTISPGSFLNEGDRIVCSQTGQVQLAWRDGSQIILLESARGRLEKILAPAEGKRRNIFYVELGRAYAKIQPLTGTEEFQFWTPHLRVTIRGTEFTFDVAPDETVFRLHDGFAYVQSAEGGDGTNMIAGQRVIVGATDPVLRPQEFSGRNDLEGVQILQEEKAVYEKMHRPFSMLLCGKPSTYIYFRLDAANQEIVSMHIPPNTWVGDFVTGFEEFEKSFLYGGAKFAVTLAERILRQKIDDLLVFGVLDVERSVDLLNGINMDLDAQSAAMLKLTAGPMRLNGEQVARLLAPGADFQGMAERQKKVLTLFVDGLRKKNIVLSTSIMGRALGGTETSLSVPRAMEVYSTFNAVRNWNYRALTMPGKSFDREGKTLVRPLPDQLGVILVK